MRTCALLLAVSTTVFAGNIRVVPLTQNPEPKGVQVQITEPEDGILTFSQPIKVALSVRNFPLGVITQTPRKDEFRGSSKGSTVHLFIDNGPYIALGEYYELPVKHQKNRYERQLVYQVPAKLKRGEHIIRALPVTSYGESIKDPDALDTTIFFLSDKRGKWRTNFDPAAPFLTYNEPQGTFDAKKGILLDFFLSNCELSRTGYKIYLYINEDKVETLTSYLPYALYGLEKGLHRITLELVDKDGKFVEGPFNKTTREIVVK